jgi:GNAT superfamily N-acetyltransferase
MTAPGGRNSLDFDGWVFRKLEESEYSRLGWFDCGDDEINDFFLNDAVLHKRELLAESYVYEYKDSPVALVSIQNDSVRFDDDENKERQKFGKSLSLPFPKRYKSIPAVKLGRIGVHKNYKRQGIGSNLLTYCKRLFVTDNRTGCRLITVDSYIKRMSFYENNGFILFPNQSLDIKAEDDTIIMYCDLKPYANQLNQAII